MHRCKARKIQEYIDSTFSSLKIRNYRLYFISQAISTIGTFMQSIAQAWLVLKLTNSGTALGIAIALQYLPMLLFAPFGGVIADRYDKRKILYFTQASFGLLALILGFLVWTNLARLWIVNVLAFLLGLLNAIDNPTRHTFVMEMVGRGQIRNAVTLYTSMINLSRVIGPAVAAFMIVTVGLAPCFILNGISYLAVIIGLSMMRYSEFRKTEAVSHNNGEVLDGFRYVAAHPVLSGVIIMLAIIGTLTFEFQVSLPLLAEFTFKGNVGSYAALSAVLGLGGVIGGLLIASQKRTTLDMLVGSAFFFGIFTLLVSMMPNLPAALLMIFIVGFFSVYFTSLANSILQLQSSQEMRGRVMSFWAMSFIGSTTIGGPIIGMVGEYMGPRWGLFIGGFGAVIASIIGAHMLSSAKKRVFEESP